MINLLARKHRKNPGVTSYKRLIKSGVRSTTMWDEQAGKQVDAA